MQYYFLSIIIIITGQDVAWLFSQIAVIDLKELYCFVAACKTKYYISIE